MRHALPNRGLRRPKSGPVPETLWKKGSICEKHELQEEVLERGVILLGVVGPTEECRATKPSLRYLCASVTCAEDQTRTTSACNTHTVRTQHNVAHVVARAPPHGSSVPNPAHHHPPTCLSAVALRRPATKQHMSLSSLSCASMSLNCNWTSLKNNSCESSAYSVLQFRFLNKAITHHHPCTCCIFIFHHVSWCIALNFNLPVVPF